MFENIGKSKNGNASVSMAVDASSTEQVMLQQQEQIRKQLVKDIKEGILTSN